MFSIKKILFFIILVLGTFNLKAQLDKASMAYSLLQKEELDSALTAINEAIVHPSTLNDGQVWYLRGFILKSIYNKREKANKESPARIEALNSFKRSMSLDISAENLQDNAKSIKYLTNTLYNDAAISLEMNEYKIAIRNFEKYKEYYMLVDPTGGNIKQKEIEFKLALATVYDRLYKSDRVEKAEFFDLSKNQFLEVVKLDSNNINANYGLAILYFNKAVNTINESDYVDILMLSELQDEAITLFKQSLPFMEKAYTLNPKRKETLIGLSQIHKGLNDFDKEEMYNKKLEELKIKE